MAHSFLTVITIFTCSTVAATGRLITTTNSSSGIVSDGVHGGYGGVLRLNPFLSLSSSIDESGFCEQTYGFMPCTTTVFGNLFLILVYGYLMFLAATYLSAGSELMLEILGPGIVGGLFLPILGALPDAMLILDILKHLQEHTVEKILAEDGSANLSAIKGFFTKIDQDGDNYISFSELKELLQDIKLTQLTWNKEKTVEEILKEFDTDADCKVSMEEFIDRFTKWLDETKNAVDHRSYRSIRSWKDLYQIVQPWVQTKKKEQEMMKILVSEIIKHVQRFPLGNFYNEDGTPNVSAIKGLFDRIDLDKDKRVSQSELKRLIMKINSEKIQWNVDEATDHIMQDLDKSGDQQIDEQEFIDGFKEWLHTSNDEIIPISPGAENDASLQPWERWIDDGIDKSGWAWTKAIMFLVLGIAMLALLAEPLIHSVQNVANVANIPSFFVSFILVPLATNARSAISAIQTANRRKERTTSLTFSELYHGVFMNNVLGFSVLLAVIYFRDLTWDFSGEVLAVLVVCIIVGTTASFRSKFPIWTSFIAYLLYPLSLIFVFIFNKL